MISEHENKSVICRVLGITDEFSMADRLTYFGVMSWQSLWVITFFVVTAIQLTVGLTTDWWGGFWHVYVVVLLILGAIVTVWFIIGGGKNLIELYARLKSTARDFDDDGMVGSMDKNDEDKAA